MIKTSSPLRAFLKFTDFCLYRNYGNKYQEHEQTYIDGTVVFYDHECPFCRQEMLRLKSLDSEDRLILLNMNSPVFDEHYWGVTREDASQALHVLTTDKTWLVGMPAIRHVYSQVGLGWLMAPSGWPVISRFADLAYRYIAPNRYAFSRWLGLGKAGNKCTDKVCGG